MKVNLNVILRDIESDEDLTYMTKNNEEKPFSAAIVCVRALMQVFKGEEEISGEIKLNRYNLASRIKNCEKRNVPVHLVPEELVEIKKVVSKAFGTIIVGQMLPILDGAKEEAIIQDIGEAKAAS